MDRTPEEFAIFLKKRGYKEFKPGLFHNEGIERCFQKRVTDEKGTRYFIDVNQWRGMTNPHTGEKIPVSYEYETYLYNLDREPVRMLFYAGWDIEKVEAHINKLFETGLYSYYEEDENA